MITPAFAFIVFLVIIVISIVVAWFMRDYSHYDKSTFHTFISILMGLGVVVTFMFYYAIVEEQQNQRKLTGLQQLNNFNVTMLNSILKEINKSVDVIPEFISSINPLTMTRVLQPDENTEANQAFMTTLSYRLFSIWQDYVFNKALFNNAKTSSENAYLCNFLQRANSRHLFELWTRTKIDFSSKAQSFGDLLFEYALPITIQEPSSYVEAANKMIDDPRYQDLD